MLIAGRGHDHGSAARRVVRGPAEDAIPVRTGPAVPFLVETEADRKDVRMPVHRLVDPLCQSGRGRYSVRTRDLDVEELHLGRDARVVRMAGRDHPGTEC